MSVDAPLDAPGLGEQLAEATAIIQALLSGQIDAVVDSKSRTPVMLSKAQAALRESEERYRRIVETTNEGIWTVDGKSKITFVNQRLAEMLGYRAEEMLGKPLFEFVPKAAAVIAVLRFDNPGQGISAENELPIARKDGSELWALLKMSPIRDPADKYIGTLVMMTDRTHRRQAEEALRKSEEQYRQIVEATTDGIIKIDVGSRIVFVNRRFVEMLGYESQEMIGRSVFDFMSAAAKVIARESFQRPRGGVKEPVDTTLRHKDGTDISVNLADTPLVDAAGQRIGNLAMVRDATEREKLQSQLMVSDRMASVGTLAAGVAHEINNPLAAVIANLDYIAEGLQRALRDASDVTSSGHADVLLLKEIQASLCDASEAAERVRFIVRDLKIFSRSPADEPSGFVDVNATMDSSLRMAWNEIRHRARLVKQYGAVPGVEANEARLGQVFLNLVVNAAQALPEGRAEQNEIRVATRLEGARVIVEVADTGAGIPPEIIGRIFDAFYTSKAVGVGTGLGLAICQRVVTDLGGELTVQSEVGKGTVFRVALPLARRKEESNVSAPAPPLAATGRRGRILVVDDETLVLGALKRTLSNQHDVIALASARQALALCANGEKFDLIICDLMMPDMTGMDLHDELMGIDPQQASKMLFLTGGAFTAAAQIFLADSAKQHLDKPFEAASLRAIVQGYVR